jgi:hypothetical protein
MFFSAPPTRRRRRRVDSRTSPTTTNWKTCPRAAAAVLACRRHCCCCRPPENLRQNHPSDRCRLSSPAADGSPVLDLLTGRRRSRRTTVFFAIRRVVATLRSRTQTWASWTGRCAASPAIDSATRLTRLCAWASPRRRTVARARYAAPGGPARSSSASLGEWCNAR